MVDSPAGIAIDPINKYLYVIKDGINAADPVGNADHNQNYVDRYTINADNTLTFESNILTSNDPDNGAIVQPRDLELTQFAGADFLAWVDQDTNNAGGNPFFLFYRIGSPPGTPLNAMQMTGPMANGLTVVPGTNIFALADGQDIVNVVVNPGIPPNGPSYILLNTLTAADVVGLQYAEHNSAGYFWWSSDTGEIGAADATLGALNPPIFTGLNSPIAIAVADIPEINTPPEVTNNGLQGVLQGSAGKIKPANLSTIDADSSAEQILYTLDSIPGTGTLQLSGVDLIAGQTFTQDDINKNRLEYLHDGDEVVFDSFLFTVEDEDNPPTVPQLFEIAITGINTHVPVAVTDHIQVLEGDATNKLFDVNGDPNDVQDTNLLTNDTDADAGDTLTAYLETDLANGPQPVNGTVTVNTDGTFVYTHNGSETTTDSFTYYVEDTAKHRPTQK